MAEIKRYLNSDGKLNIIRKGVKRFPFSDLYHTFLSVSWPGFLSFVFASYLLINISFAAAFFLCGPEALAGVRRGSVGEHFLDCFFFSVQTVATIGYGRISPLSLGANLLVTTEALVGLMSLALVTGMLFSRFSKPTARVLFSRKALIREFDGEPYLLFRMANQRLDQIIEARIHVTAILNDIEDGKFIRRIHNLKLERSESSIFALSWVVSHPLDEESPLYGLSPEQLAERQAEILVTLTGTDEVFSQSIHARYAYSMEDVVWNAKFKDMISSGDGGPMAIDLERIHDYEMIQ